MRVRAPAKLNLFLHVTGRRADGYHDLETVFQLVDLADVVTVTAREDGIISRTPPPSDPALAALAEGDDLTVRAARLLKEESGVALGADLHVEKHIPNGGGLGGGSSDAAAVLLALNELWELNWSIERLSELGGRLGADIPVFIGGQNAFASGKGDQLTPVELPAQWYLIVHPGIAVSTAEVFADPELTRDTPPLRIAAVPPGGGRNDCEPVVRRREPAVAAALDWFADLGIRARMTGTGSCVFAGFGQEAEARELAARLPGGWRGIVTRGLVRPG